MFFIDKKACDTCAGRRTLSSSCTVVHMPSSFMCNWLPDTKKCSAASLPLMETALLTIWRACCRWHHYLYYGRFRVASALLWCGGTRFAVARRRATALARCAYESRQCISVHPGTAELDSFFSLSQRWHRQEQKLLFTSLPWHVELIGAFTPPTSLSGGCLEENAGDVVQSVAGRVLGRLLHLNGWGMEPRVLFASRRSTRVADLCTFLQNMHVAQRLVSFDGDMR